MRNAYTIKLYDSLTNIDTELIKEADTQKDIPFRSIKSKRILLIAAIIAAALAFCGFAAYQADLFDFWIQKPSKSPVETVRSAIENQKNKDYVLVIQIKNIEIDKRATERALEMYKGSDLAEYNGWSDEYMENNFIAVRAEYYAKYDHTKTFFDDGEIVQYFFLTRNEITKRWKIWDNTSPGFPYISDCDTT